jgi:ELWxxDGT repeat protein
MNLRCLSVALLACSLTLKVSAQTCRLVADLEPGSRPSSPAELRCAFGDMLVFSAASPGVGHEPRTSRKGGMPVLIKDLHPSGDSFPREFVVCGDRVFFSADDGSNGRELWGTDGTAAGTWLVKDIRAGGLSSDVRDIVCVGNRVVFRANDGVHGNEIWASDGTAAGTVLLKDIRPGTTGSDPSEVIVFGGRAFFAANDGTNGVELWVSDGSANGTFLFKDLNPGSPSSAPSDFYCHQDALWFRARAGRLGFELWSSDGSANGTSLVKDINAGSGDSNPRNFVTCGNALLFSASTTQTGVELFMHDASGTRLVRDIRPGGFSSSPSGLTCVNGVVFFSAIDGSSGFELWKTDGQASGTVLVKDIRVGSSSSTPEELVRVGRRLYFRADDGSATGLWISDGTRAGTRRVCGTVTSPRHMTLCGCKLLFSAYTPQTSHELHAIDLPGASVTHFGQACPPSRPTMTSTLPVLGTTATLSGADGPANSIGLVLLDVEPRQALVLPSGCRRYVQPLVIAGALVTPKWTLALPIPNDPRLDGACVPAQTWWLTLGTILPIRTTNGVMLGLGR